MKWPKLNTVIGFLKFVGTLNAAIWLGMTVFHLFGASPALQSDAVRLLLGERYFPYFSGVMAQIVAERFFHWLLACGLLALAHLVGERLYLGRKTQRVGFGMVIGLLAVILCLGLIVQPKQRLWHVQSHAVNATAPQRAASQRELRRWNGYAWALHLVLVAGLGVHFWRLVNPPEEKRFLGLSQFHG